MKSKYVRIPDKYRNLRTAQLETLIRATGDPDGERVITEMTEYAATSTCRGCARRKVDATMRVWMTLRDERLRAAPEPEPAPEPAPEPEPVPEPDPEPIETETEEDEI